MSDAVHIVRRPIAPDDEPFLERLFATVTAEQLKFASLGIDGEHAAMLVAHQYAAYSHFYKTTYASADDSILEVDGVPVGRLIIIELPGEIRLSDIMIMPEFRRRGICTHVMREEIARGSTSDRVVTLHVERSNPALELYRREGFVVRGESDTHFVMEWARHE